MKRTFSKSFTKNHNRVICLPFEQKTYHEVIHDAQAFRMQLDEFIQQLPQLFPAKIVHGYRMKDIRFPKKLPVPIRRIEIGRTGYTIRPSFVMPHMTGMTESVEKALFLRKYNVPFHALSYCFGYNAMKWFRLEQSLGRNHLVGTTILWEDDLPQHIDADEKHTWILGEKAYITVTSANNCIFGASIVRSADETQLTQGYGVFKQETQAVIQDYAPKTVTTDGWLATQNSWKILFPSILLIACFLHIFLKIRSRTKNKLKEAISKISTQLWSCYRATNKRTFSQRVRRLVSLASKNNLPSVIVSILEKLREKSIFFTNAYDFPEAPRTTNMVDRLMRPLDKRLFCSQYFHGTLESAELSVRAFALYQNFTPSNPYTIKKYNGWQSPAERLNQFCYHDNWLQNLLVAASQRRFFSSPQNPL